MENNKEYSYGELRDLVVAWVKDLDKPALYDICLEYGLIEEEAQELFDRYYDLILNFIEEHEN